jgi:hypothetical protein
LGRGDCRCEGENLFRLTWEMSPNCPALIGGALAPSVVHACFRLLASLLRKRRIVGIAFGPTAIIRGSIVGIEARGHAQPVRQIWVGQKLAAKGDQIRFALLEPCFRGVSIKAAGYDQRSAIFLPNKRKQLLRAGVRRIAFLDRGETRIHDMQIGETKVAENFRYGAEGPARRRSYH